MIMPFFGWASGLADADPVGGSVASCLETILFHEGFKEIDGMVIGRWLWRQASGRMWRVTHGKPVRGAFRKRH